jgi:hypothetical protein
MNALAHPTLELLLEHHRALLAVDEIVRQIAPDPADFSDRDDVLVAIRELTQAGLVHRLHEFVFASVAAIHFKGLQSM